MSSPTKTPVEVCGYMFLTEDEIEAELGFYEKVRVLCTSKLETLIRTIKYNQLRFATKCKLSDISASVELEKIVTIVVRKTGENVVGLRMTTQLLVALWQRMLVKRKSIIPMFQLSRNDLVPISWRIDCAKSFQHVLQRYSLEHGSCESSWSGCAGDIVDLISIMWDAYCGREDPEVGEGDLLAEPLAKKARAEKYCGERNRWDVGERWLQNIREPEDSAEEDGEEEEEEVEAQHLELSEHVELPPDVQQPLDVALQRWLQDAKFDRFSKFFEREGFFSVDHLPFLLDETDEIEALLKRLCGDNAYTHFLLRKKIDPQWKSRKVMAPKVVLKAPPSAPRAPVTPIVKIPVTKMPAKRPRKGL